MFTLNSTKLCEQSPMETWIISENIVDYLRNRGKIALLPTRSLSSILEW